MKRLIPVLVVLFFAASATPSFAAMPGEKKATKSATRKNHDKSDGCGDMKMADCAKKDECCKMDSKKESSKTEKEESKKESEKK